MMQSSVDIVDRAIELWYGSNITMKIGTTYYVKSIVSLHGAGHAMMPHDKAEGRS